MNSANWNTQKTSGQWTTADNWDGDIVPTDTATFETTSPTSVTFSSTDSATVQDIVFSAGSASNTFTFTSPVTTPSLTITGSVTNNSGTSQHFTVASIGVEYQQPQLKFSGNAKAGSSDMCYIASPESPESYGGGIIGFWDNASAQTATFTVTTGAGTPPETGSTVGAEVSFSNYATADNAHFTIYGSTSLTDGDTFGNVVFHDEATAANGIFTNIGGTVPGGDGGNTQFYNQANAGSATFNNRGGTNYGIQNGEEAGANGGDVAFDGTSNADNASFYNHAATISGAHGGVTSFNNNKPEMGSEGASGGNGFFHNYGASVSGAGGGHTEFSGDYGMPTAANATLINYGGKVSGAYGGYTSFSNSATAGNASLTAKGNTGEGEGGKIAFYDQSTGGAADVYLYGTGILDISDHTGDVTIGTLTMSGGVINLQVGTSEYLTRLWVTGELSGAVVNFSFWGSNKTGFEPGVYYTILGANNLQHYSADQFTGNDIGSASPVFSIDDYGNLQVCFKNSQ